MNVKPPQNPICHHLSPDRVLLGAACQVEGCLHRVSDPHGAVPDLPPCLMGQQQHTVVEYDGLRRLALMVTPSGGGDFKDQAWETVSTIRAILRQQGEPMAVTMQTVFLADADQVPAAKRLFEAYYERKCR